MHAVATSNATDRGPVTRPAGLAVGAFHVGYSVWALRLGRRRLTTVNSR